jgi:hypothetical protein
MPKIARESLLTLEAYARERSIMRADVISHKLNRRVQLGGHVTLIFEDEKTIRYQVQEMLRAERAFEDRAIREELDAYNPLIPDGSNFKATMMIEYPDPLERARELARLVGVEDRVLLSVGTEVICAMADEDLDRENDVKTSAVHFLRFELSASAVNAVKSGSAMRLAIDHPNYSFEALLPDHVRASLCMDLV